MRKPFAEDYLEAQNNQAAPNNGMHPTRDTLPVIKLQLVGGRVMPGVRLLLEARGGQK
jgi:hypothetical protein